MFTHSIHQNTKGYTLTLVLTEKHLLAHNHERNDGWTRNLILDSCFIPKIREEDISNGNYILAIMSDLIQEVINSAGHEKILKQGIGVSRSIGLAGNVVNC